MNQDLLLNPKERPIMKLLRHTLAVIAIVAVVSASPVGAQAGKDVYLKDFEFIRDAVKENGAAIERHDLDWKAICEEAEPRFAGAESDARHVANVMRLLATLRDSHTSISETSVPQEELPSKWDGLYGGGLWFGWEDGRIVARGMTRFHSLGNANLYGWALYGINKQPAWFVLDREKRRITEFFGSSSDHSLFASMGNRLLPFGEEKVAEIRLMPPSGTPFISDIARFGNKEGMPCYPYSLQLPIDVEWKEGAVSVMLNESWCEKVGYIRITGSMNEETVDAFHAAFDKLEGAEAVLLDCRGMGGGSDEAAWKMAGRFFKKGVSNGSGNTIEPAGSWQFDGPVVMLQDELEVSAAETFTWAMCETKRALSVGRPTGGWAIIPQAFECPSGLVSFRLGVRDRPTPISGKMTEGIGWPPDVPFPYGPALCMNPDQDGNIGLQLLRLLHAGADRLSVIRCFNHVRTGNISEFLKEGTVLARKATGWDPKLLAELFHDDLKKTIVLETFLLTNAGDIVPDAAGSARRFLQMAPRARNANLSAEFTEWQKALAPLKAEAEAQNAFFEMPSSELDPESVPWKVFLAKYGETKTGQFLAGAVGQP